MFHVDTKSIAHQTGYEHGLADAAFRCPVKGNPRGEDNYYFGYLAGRSERIRRGLPVTPSQIER